MRHAFLSLLALPLLAAPLPSHAKDLRQKVGVGYTWQTREVPTLSVKYGLPAGDKSINIQIEAVGGAHIAVGSDDLDAIAGLRLLYGVVAEDNMNLYLGAGGFFVISGTEGSDWTGVRVQPVLGAEFFPYGLENLGLSVEGGLGADISQDGIGVSTRTGSSLGLGFHYYF